MIYKNTLYRNIIENNNNIIAGTSIRTVNKKNFNLSIKNNTKENINNRKALLNSLGLKLSNSVFINQTHSNNLSVITEKDKGKGSVNAENIIAGCDAMISKEKNITLCIMTADCLPIFIYDKLNKTIAIAHAGWRGTQKQIIKNTINKLISNFNGKTNNIIISFGPGIGKCCYEVSIDFKDKFPNSAEERNNKIYLDLVKENSLQAKTLGIKQSNILTDSYICSACNNDLFYSYRKDTDKTNRMISLISRL